MYSECVIQRELSHGVLKVRVLLFFMIMILYAFFSATQVMVSCWVNSTGLVVCLKRFLRRFFTPERTSEEFCH